jgi:hypothetical protein
MPEAGDFSPKYIRDPIHDIVKIEEKYILDLLNTAAMQRLRFIRQLGFAWLVYPGAEHSRFTHSLGVYHLAKRLAHTFDIEGLDRRAVVTAALLHDVGHGPFSHEFERFMKDLGYSHYVRHEKRSASIVLEDPQIKNILSQVDPALPNRVAGILDPDEHEDLYEVVVSSQLDADRFDYMLRDSHMTGVKYGKFDLNWMFRTLSLQSYTTYDPVDKTKTKDIKVVAVDSRRGISALEEYLLGLFYLYQHVYLHKTVLAANTLFICALKRAAKMIRDGSRYQFPEPLVRIAMSKEVSDADFRRLNDFEVSSWFMKWSEEEPDPLLAALARDLMDRKLFKTFNVKGKFSQMEKIKERLFARAGDKADYYVSILEPERAAYDSYFTTQDLQEQGQEIFVHDNKEGTTKFSEFAALKDLKVSGNLARLKLDERYVIVHRSLADDAQNIVDSVMR